MCLYQSFIQSHFEGHGVIIPVPVSVMDKVGTYRFVLHFYDDYADSYKNHQVKAALEVNQRYLQLPIVYIHGEFAGSEWYGAWCRMPSQVHKLTHRFNPAQSRGAVNFATNNTGKGQIRAAVNGGFFTLDKEGNVRMLGEVGTGIVGNWEEDAPYPLRRWCFGMHEKGSNFGIALMEPRPDGVHYRVAQSIENTYPFGLSGIGNLRQRDSTWPSLDGDVHRTAVAWTRRGYFFLIIARAWTWDDTYRFFFSNDRGSLIDYMQRQFNENISIANAVMLDGGRSTQFNYRRVRSDGHVDEEWRYDLSDGRRITTMVHVWAKGD
ncbi:MAG: phosphodiester glycosidase family protein [Candidatus Bathyarchaeia archaeon]